MKYHAPVLRDEVLSYLNVDKGKRYIDATLGDAGHTLEILNRGGIVLGLDYSSESLHRAEQRINEAGLQHNFTGVLTSFTAMQEVAVEHDFTEVDGIIFDLGYSSFHMDDAGLGLSYQKTEPLDMRIDKSLNVTAADIVNTLSAKQLAKLFWELGEERLAKSFAEAIVSRRSLKKLSTTTDLADLLVEIAPPGYDRGTTHPARRVFQALRILVNDELDNLKIALPRAAHLLKLPGGRMAIISFHSLEDRIAKGLPQTVRPEYNLQALTKGPIVPSEDEIRDNRRARSAKLRVYEKTN